MDNLNHLKCDFTYIYISKNVLSRQISLTLIHAGRKDKWKNEIDEELSFMNDKGQQYDTRGNFLLLA